MTILFMYIIHHVVLALGLATSLIIDIFIIIVEKTKKIRGIEKNIMKRALSYSFIFSLFIFLIQLIYFFFVYITYINFSMRTYLFSAFTLLVSTALLFATATQKYYQFKILQRYQEQHQHLSDSFITHHKEFKQTSVIILILWLALYIAYILI